MTWQRATAAWSWVVGGLFVFVALTWFRLLPLIVFATLGAVVFFLRKPIRPRIAWAALVLVVGVSFSPVDFSPVNYPGPPRVVPLVMGAPTAATLERAERGEVFLGGCIVSGHEPRWILVW